MGFFEPNIEKMEAKRDVKGLIKALRTNKYVKGGYRRAAAGALVRIGAPAVEPLIQALKDKDTVIRFGAADALGEIGDERAVEPLTKALKDEAVQKFAKEALEKIETKKG